MQEESKLGKGLCMMIRFLTSHVALASMSREVVEVVQDCPKKPGKVQLTLEFLEF